MLQALSLNIVHTVLRVDSQQMMSGRIALLLVNPAPPVVFHRARLPPFLTCARNVRTGNFRMASDRPSAKCVETIGGTISPVTEIPL